MSAYPAVYADKRIMVICIKMSGPYKKKWLQCRKAEGQGTINRGLTLSPMTHISKCSERGVQLNSLIFFS